MTILSEQNRLLGNENLASEKLVDAIHEFFQKLDDDLLKVKGSSWIIKELGNIYVYISKINTLMGSSYIVYSTTIY